MTLQEATTVSYDIRGSQITDDGIKRRFVAITIKGESMGSPELPLDLGHLKLKRLIHLHVQATELPTEVRWSGDLYNPVLRFDMWPDDLFTVVVEAVGK